MNMANSNAIYDADSSGEIFFPRSVETEISIVMPLYNAGRYLAETLESVFRQTYQSFELICVDDASTDNTGEILTRFRKKDERIRILHNQMRLGAALSRNKGMDAARGKYLTFLDGDDIFEEEMLETAHKTIEEKDADIVVYEALHVLSDCIYEKKRRERKKRFIEKYCRKCFSLNECEPIDAMNWAGAAWNKMYRSSFVFANKLQFQSLPSSNDVYFVDLAMFLARKMVMLDDRRIMVYVRDHFEPSRISIDRDPMCAYLAMEKLGKALIERDVFHKLYKQYYACLFITLKGAIIGSKTEEKAREFYQFLKTEGIKRALAMDADWRIREEYLRRPLESFLTQDFSTGWYLNETGFIYYLRKEKEMVASFFKEHESRGARIVIWGAGKRGGDFVKVPESMRYSGRCGGGQMQ